jgi:type II secretion system protein G
MKNSSKGFTLIELMVVIAIIGTLSSIVFSSLNNARGQARDAKRKGDMLNLQTALEMYYLDNGSYPPQGCYAGYQTNCGVLGSTLSGPTGYIPNLAPLYISVLPVDPSNNFGACNGYLYCSNGTDYLLLDHAVPESWPVAGTKFYDPQRPNWSWKVCNDKTQAYAAPAGYCGN